MDHLGRQGSRQQLVSSMSLQRWMMCYGFHCVPLNITTLGTPAFSLTSLKSSITERGFAKSLGMCVYFSSSPLLRAWREDTMTRYPCEVNARAQLRPTPGPAPMMSAIGDFAMVECCPQWSRSDGNASLESNKLDFQVFRVEMWAI